MAEHRVRPGLAIDVHRIGQSREPVLVIDHVLEHPDLLVRAAAAASGWREGPAGGYPGRRAPVPASYARALIRRIDFAIRRELLPGPARLARFDAFFAMVTRPPESLHPLQRVPHIDIADPWRVALVHFLCGEPFGGTAFFRQDATGLEQVTPPEREAHATARAEAMAGLGAEHGYPEERTPGYSEIARFPARFDCLLAYRSLSLHSGIIDDPALLSPDPLQGRLTTTLFLDYAPAAC